MLRGAHPFGFARKINDVGVADRGRVNVTEIERLEQVIRQGMVASTCIGVPTGRGVLPFRSTATGQTLPGRRLRDCRSRSRSCPNVQSPGRRTAAPVEFWIAPAPSRRHLMHRFKAVIAALDVVFDNFAHGERGR